jgi:mannosyltransferase
MSNTADAAAARNAGRSQPVADPNAVDVIAPNFKRRLSGITSTVIRVVPEQAKSLRIATAGTPLPLSVPWLPWSGLAALWSPPSGHSFRVWHARRNTEMAAGVFLRDVLRMPLRLVFTSASQRHHTWSSRFLISRMDAVISTSGKTAGYLRRPSTVVMHGIDTAVFHPPASKAAAKAALGLGDGLVVGCFGRIRRQKGTDVFVDAMIAVLPQFPTARAVVLGRATAEHRLFLADLKRRAAEAGLAGRITFPGEVPADATAAWYQALDVFVAPQRWEGFGVTPLEAAATGLPVVATTVGAFPELVGDGTTGILVPPGDPLIMSAGVRTLLADPALRAAYGGAARQRVARDFSLTAEAEGINAVYRQLWAASA